MYISRIRNAVEVRYWGCGVGESAISTVAWMKWRCYTQLFSVTVSLPWFKPETTQGNRHHSSQLARKLSVLRTEGPCAFHDSVHIIIVWTYEAFVCTAYFGLFRQSSSVDGLYQTSSIRATYLPGQYQYVHIGSAFTCIKIILLSLCCRMYYQLDNLTGFKY